MKQDYTYPPETTLTDGAGNSYTLSIADLLADPDAQRSEDGKTITVQKGSKTYTLTLGDETTAGQAELSNQDLAALMGGEEKGYTVGKDGALYLTKDGETCKLDAYQTALLRKQMKVHVKVENDKGTLGSQQLADGSQTPEQAAAAAKQAALENALTAAAAKAPAWKRCLSLSSPLMQTAVTPIRMTARPTLCGHGQRRDQRDLSGHRNGQ